MCEYCEVFKSLYRDMADQLAREHVARGKAEARVRELERLLSVDVALIWCAENDPSVRGYVRELRRRAGLDKPEAPAPDPATLGPLDDPATLRARLEQALAAKAEPAKPAPVVWRCEMCGIVYLRERTYCLRDKCPGRLVKGRFVPEEEKPC